MAPIGLVVLIGDARSALDKIAALLPEGVAIIPVPSPEAAIRALSRFIGRRAHDGQRRLRVRHLQVDIDARLAMWRGTDLALTPHEFELLAAVVAQPGHAVPFGELITRVWGSHNKADVDMLRSAVKRLRRKLADAGADAQIEAVRGYGFRLNT